MSTVSPDESPVDANEERKGNQRAIRSIRWWPAILVILFVSVVLAYTQLSDAFTDQIRVVAVQVLPVLGLLLLWVWLLVASRLSIRRRLTVSAGMIAIVAVLFACVRWNGVNGDLWFQFSWRWSAQPLSVVSARNTASPSLAIDLTHTTPRDYPQFLGPTRLGTTQGLSLSYDWDTNPPELLWRQPIGQGWSSFAVVGDYAVTQEQRGEQELTVCYELRTGREIWVHAEKARFLSPISGDGPRSTPTIVDGRVYSCGGTGILCCLNGATGKLIWRHNLLAEHGTINNEFGNACSPLLYDDVVVVTTGGQTGPTLAAYDQQDGSLVWASATKDQMSYVSPSLATLCGRRQIVVLNHPAVSGYDPNNGDKLWDYEWPGNESKASQPVPLDDDKLFVSSGYGVGCGLLQLEVSDDGSFTVQELWHSKDLKTKFTTAMLLDGHAYALDNGILSCVELSTGKRRWKRGRYGHGQVILINDVLLVVCESGEVALVEAQPESYVELTRFAALDSKTWNTPALSGDLLLVRNDREAACYRLPQSQQ